MNLRNASLLWGDDVVLLVSSDPDLQPDAGRFEAAGVSQHLRVRGRGGLPENGRWLPLGRE